MEKFEKIDNEQRELVKYWIDRFYKECSPLSRHEWIEKNLTPKPVIEAGKWYFIERDASYGDKQPALIFTGAWYGFNHSGGWCSGYGKSIKSYIVTEATPEEVEQRLIEEAKRRGYKATNFKSIDGINEGEFEHGIFSTTIKGSNHRIFTASYGGMVCYKNGKWAEIIDEKAELKEEVKRLSDQLIIVKQKLGINNEL